ncbi:MAG: Mini-ribonuclease 3 [Clostridia bacterium]|nr:Mini-ribonuclease 3 [Clostridia bacterium]
MGDIIDKEKANTISPVVLAFIGDAVYSLFIREKLVFSKDYKTGELNKLATSEVKATSQAEYARKIMPFFTEEEVLIYKRGRNAKKSTKSKSASVSEYNSSTGFEALLGYLYIIGNYERLNYILNKGREDES